MSLISLVSKLSKDYKQNKERVVRLIEFLNAYGYLPKDRIADLDAVNVAISLFKDFYAFSDTSPEITGQILRAIEMPRCSLPDIQNLTEEQTESYKWRKNKINYAVTSYVNGLSKSVQDDIFNKAFQSWARVANLTFNQVNTTTEADIVISTGRGGSSDFDGPSGTLAWAQLPQGDNRKLLMKFDLDETWVDSPNKRGIILLNVSAHEFGHNLGLNHSKVQGALMAPYYTAGIAEPQLRDDVPRIQSLYGKPVSAPTPVPTPTPTPIPNPPTDNTKKKIIIEYTGNIDSILCDGFRIQKLG